MPKSPVEEMTESGAAKGLGREAKMGTMDSRLFIDWTTAGLLPRYVPNLLYHVFCR